MLRKRGSDCIRETLQQFSDQELAVLLTEELARRPALRAVRDDVTALLTMSPTLTSQQNRAVDGAVSRSQIITNAKSAILRDHEMFDADAVTRLLGHNTSKPDTLDLSATDDAVIALPVHPPLYPAFQFDAAHHRIRPIVATINHRLDAANDPWGVASWWLNPTAFEDDPRPPAELAIAGGHEQDLLDMADDLTQE